MFYESEESTIPRFDPVVVGNDLAPGVLELSLPEGATRLPLVSLDYQARVVDRVADVTVTQVFDNPYKERLEATYIFPLAGGSAVRSFELRVAGRTIRGVVRERSEARAAYRKAIEEGRRAAIVEKERDNVFTVQVGNLPPGERATIVISYVERLDLYDEHRTELRLPLVVAPRYVPGTPLDRQNAGTGVEDDTDAVPDASRVTPPRLAPGSLKGPEVTIEVAIAMAGGTIEDLACSQHATAVGLGREGVVVRLSRNDERPNRDFVLRWRTQVDAIHPSLAVYRAPEKGLYGMLSLVAPGGTSAVPRDVVFVIDRSGSMTGAKMRSAARASAILLDSLAAGDRYAIAAFDNSVEWLEGGTFVEASETGKTKGRTFLKGVEARGGTEIDAALAAAFEALARRSDVSDRLAVVVLVTDGQVANEHEVLGRVAREIGSGRLFAIGVDTAVNDAFLVRLARAGHGTSSLVEPGTALEDALASVAREIGAPALMGLELRDLDAGELAIERAPARLPDLFAGRAATVFLRLESAGAVEVSGVRPDGTRFVETVSAREVDHPAIAQLWARARIEELEDAFRVGDTDRARLRREIVELAIAHEIVTRFTAYLAVDDEVLGNEGELRRITQPVDMPEAWEMQDASLLAAMPVPTATASFAPGGIGAPARMLHQAFGEAPPAAPAPAESAAHGLARWWPWKRRRNVDDSMRRRLAERIDELGRLLERAVELASRAEAVDYTAIRRVRDEIADLLTVQELRLTVRSLSDWLGREYHVVERVLRGEAREGETLDVIRPYVAQLTNEIAAESKRALAGSDGDAFWEATI